MDKENDGELVFLVLHWNEIMVHWDEINELFYKCEAV